ncbi:MAG: ArgR family transcriptional regulator [Bdellovibrionota bacterium]
MSTQAEARTDTKERLMVLRQLIREGTASTQEELCEALRDKDFDVTQSTVSRDLRRIGAIKTTNSEGEIIYRLPEHHQLLPPRVVSHSLDGLLTEVQANESMIVLHTTPGSASLVARHLDSIRLSLGIIGTLAGDDCIFIVPASVKKISSVIKKVKEEFY